VASSRKSCFSFWPVSVAFSYVIVLAHHLCNKTDDDDDEQLIVGKCDELRTVE